MPCIGWCASLPRKWPMMTRSWLRRVPRWNGCGSSSGACNGRSLDGDRNGSMAISFALGLEDLDADVARAQASYRTVAADHAETEPAARRQAFPDHLSREDMTVDVEGRLCPCCGGTLHVIGETVSEMLDFIPARLRVLRIRRPKYASIATGSEARVRYGSRR